jgi:hypothetical protein
MLWAEWSGDRIPVGESFSAPVQSGSEAHPASHTMGTGSFPGVKRPGRDIDHPFPLKLRLKEVRSCNFTPRPGLHGRFWGEFCLYLYLLPTVQTGSEAHPISR